MNDDLDILLARYFDGSASDEEVTSLERLLASDSTAAHALLSAARQELALRDAHGLGPTAGVASQQGGATGELKAVAATSPASPRTTTTAYEIDENQSQWRIRSWRPWGLAASLLLVAGLVWYVVPGPTAPVVHHSNPPEPAGAVATVEPVGPGVVIEHNGVATPIDHNTNLSANDRLRTGPSAGATFNYQAEKTRVTLGASSVLGIGNDQSGKKLDLVAGVVDCEVEQQQPGRGLVVTTPQARVRVVGTQFRVITAGRLTRVEVSHGIVRVTRLADGATVDVSSGEFVDVGVNATTRPTVAPGWPVAQGRNMAEFWSTRIRPAGINE